MPSLRRSDDMRDGFIQRTYSTLKEALLPLTYATLATLVGYVWFGLT
jgi:hypothetical protein